MWIMWNVDNVDKKKKKNVKIMLNLDVVSLQLLDVAM